MKPQTGSKVAIITAASRGIGLACARELKEKGFELALMSRSGAIDDAAKELGAISLRGSVSEPRDLAALVERTMDVFGRVDAVVNNSGNPEGGELLGIPDEQWQEVFEMYFLSIVRMSRLVVPLMSRQGGGAIVNISGSSALEPDARFPVADTMRASMAAYTKLFARAHGPQNIRMNCVAPSVTFDYDPDAIRPDIRAEIPLGRPARYAEIASVVAFLLSPGAAYISGETIKVDGGATRGL